MLANLLILTLDYPRVLNMSAVDTFSEAAAAAAGGFFSCSVLYPIEICKNKLQVL